MKLKEFDIVSFTIFIKTKIDYMKFNTSLY